MLPAEPPPAHRIDAPPSPQPTPLSTTTTAAASSSSVNPSPPVSSTENESEAVARLRLSTLTPLLVLSLIYVALILVLALQREAILPLLERFSAWARSYGLAGHAAMAALTALTAIPPVPGYGLVAVLAGVIYGWLGLASFYVGALSGACLTFFLFRRLATGYAARLQLERPRVAAVVRAVERRGFRLLFFIRCAPYPFSLLNAILASAQRITFPAFFFATALTIPKLAINVGLGAHLKDIAEALFEKPSPARWAALVAFIVIAIAVFAYVGWIGLKEIRVLEKEGSRGATRVLRKKSSASRLEKV